MAYGANRFCHIVFSVKKKLAAKTVTEKKNDPGKHAQKSHKNHASFLAR